MIFQIASKKWHLRKKWNLVSASRLQEYNGFKVFLKLPWNLCLHKGMGPNISLVRIFMYIRSKISKSFFTTPNKTSWRLANTLVRDRCIYQDHVFLFSFDTMEKEIWKYSVLQLEKNKCILLPCRNFKESEKLVNMLNDFDLQNKKN